MTHSIAATSNPATAPQTAGTRSRASTGTSFAAVHAAAVKDKPKSTEAAGTSNDAAKGTAEAPKGERTQKVAGHTYVEIISGPRNGMFINNSGNARDGEAFLIVKRDGREFHIYGTGKDRAVFEVGRERDAAPKPATGTTGTGTSATPAAGATGSTPGAGTTAIT